MVHVNIGISGDLIQSVTVKGHACSGEYGQDLVCAGVSSIMTGALNALDILFPDQCRLVMSGNRMEAAAASGNKQLQAVLRAIEIQLETMAEQFPDNINVIRKEV